MNELCIIFDNVDKINEAYLTVLLNKRKLSIINGQLTHLFGDGESSHVLEFMVSGECNAFITSFTINDIELLNILKEEAYVYDEDIQFTGLVIKKMTVFEFTTPILGSLLYWIGLLRA
jgi:hypothetical protein